MVAKARSENVAAYHFLRLLCLHGFLRLHLSCSVGTALERKPAGTARGAVTIGE